MLYVNGFTFHLTTLSSPLPLSQFPLHPPPSPNSKMRFLDCTNGRKDPSKSILDVGVADAMKFSGFDVAMFKKRGGVYNWSKADMRLDW